MKLALVLLSLMTGAAAAAEDERPANEVPAFRQLLTEANDRLAATAGKLAAANEQIKSLTDQMAASKRDAEKLKTKCEAIVKEAPGP